MRFLSIVLSIGIHFSLCTGTAVAASLFPSVHADGAVIMTPAIFQVSCLQIDESPDIAIERTTTHAECGEGEDCLSVSSSLEEDRTITAEAPVEHQKYAPFSLSIHDGVDTLEYVPLARDGPLYEESFSLAHSLTKLE